MFLLFKGMLTFEYLAVLLYVLYSLIQFLRSNHKKQSFLLGFYICAACWTGMRVTFWIVTIVEVKIHGILIFLIYWLPSTIQFGMFSLLTLFYAKVLGRSHWHLTKKLLIPFSYFIFTASLLATIFWAFEAGVATADDQQFAESFQNSFVWISGIAFLLLAFLLIYDGWRIFKVDRWQTQRMFIFNPRTVAIMNVIIAVIFITRSVHNFLSISNFVNMYIPVSSEDDIPHWAFLLFTVWEFVPTVLLLLTIARPASPSRDSHGLTPDFGIYRQFEDNKHTSTSLKICVDGPGTPGFQPDGLTGNSKYMPPMILDSGIGPLPGVTRAQTDFNMIGKTATPDSWEKGGAIFENRFRYDSDDDKSSTSNTSRTSSSNRSDTWGRNTNNNKTSRYSNHR